MVSNWRLHAAQNGLMGIRVLIGTTFGLVRMSAQIPGSNFVVVGIGKPFPGVTYPAISRPLGIADPNFFVSTLSGGKTKNVFPFRNGMPLDHP